MYEGKTSYILFINYIIMKNTQTIKVNTTNAKGRLSQREFDYLMRDKSIINLTNRKTTSSKITERLIYSLVWFGFALFLLIRQTIALQSDSIPLEEQFWYEFKYLLQSENVNQEDIDNLIEIINWEYNTWSSVNSKQESVDTSLFPTELGDSEMREFFNKNLDRTSIEPQKNLDSNIQIRKDNFFICKEVNDTYLLESDVYRCAAYMSMIQLLETNNCKTWSAEQKNCFWIKIPTDKKWLVWEWYIADNSNHLWFETFEQSKYAFAYYYMNYHDERSVDNFVNRYVGWDNTKYKQFIYNNYNYAYNEYKINY